MSTNTPDQAITIPAGGDTADNVVAFTNFVADVEPRLVRSYTNEADRTAKMLVLAENGISTLGSENRAEIYDGTNQISLHTRSLYAYSRVTSDQLLTMSSTALQNLTNLVVSLPGDSGAIFRFRAFVYYDSATAADLKLAFTIPTGATMKWGVVSGLAAGASGSTGDGQFAAQTASAAATAIGGAGVGTALLCTVEGEVTMNTTAGDLQMQAAQNTSDATQSTVQARSYIEAWRSA